MNRNDFSLLTPLLLLGDSEIAIVVWYSTMVPGSKLDFFSVRPWYRHKAVPSFADMLGAAQRAALLAGVFDPSCNSNNLHNPLTPDEFRRHHTPEGAG